MSQETTDNFWAALAAWDTTPPPPVQFRLYHRDDGTVICYSHEDIPGNYIQVDPETYMLGATNVKVIDGRLVQILQGSAAKLSPSVDTGTPCDPTDVAVVVTEQKPHTKWSRKTT